MDIIILIGLVYLITHAVDHASSVRRGARDEKIAEAERKFGHLPQSQRRSLARRHNAAWTASEVLHGFPVTRTGWHAGWLAHKTTAVQQRNQREEARTQHLEVHSGFTSALAEHRRRRAVIQQQIDEAIGQSPKGREAVREAAEGAGALATVTALDDHRKAAPEPGPYAAGDDLADHLKAPVPDPRLNDVQRERDLSGQRNVCAADGRPGTADDPLLVAPDGFRVHRSDTTDPESGYYAPAAATEGNPDMSHAGAEMTYDQVIKAATDEVNDCDQRLAVLRMKQLGNLADQLAGVLRDPATLGSLADWDDAVQAEIKAVQAEREHAEAVRTDMQRNHGGMAEAHKDAPVPGAQPEFYEG
jgi:hypothetical protein